MTNELELFGKGNFDLTVLFIEKDTMKKKLKELETEVLAVVPDISTIKGRKEIASLAHKVSKSKVALDALGKDLVADWKNKAAKVDESRKYARDFLDSLKDRVRQPLTDWEIAEETRIKTEAAAAKYEADWSDACKDHEIYLRMKELERKEAELAQIKAKQLAQEQAAKEAESARKQAAIDEANRGAREKLIAEEAAAKAKKDAEQKLIAAEAKRINDLARAKAQAENKAKAEAVRQEQLRLAAERQRVAEIKAIKDAQEKKEREAAILIAKQKAEDEQRQKDKKHREKINSEAVTSLTEIIFDEKEAKTIITAISKGFVVNVSIKY